MAPKGEKEAWLNIVEPKDFDLHMANIGQAEANASLVREFFEKYPLAEGGKLLIHGCGTCQLFDYLNPHEIGGVQITFADISQKMLDSAEVRMTKFKGLKYALVQDDIEATKLTGHYDAVLLVLVLLHVDWKKSLGNILKLSPSCVYIIEQEQDPTKPSVTKERKLPPSILRYAETASAELIRREDLTEYLNEKGYALAYTKEVQVPDNKKMAGLVYARTGQTT